MSAASVSFVLWCEIPLYFKFFLSSCLVAWMHTLRLLFFSDLSLHTLCRRSPIWSARIRKKKKLFYEAGKVCLHWIMTKWLKLVFKLKTEVQWNMLRVKTLFLKCLPSVDGRYPHFAGVSPHDALRRLKLKLSNFVFVYWYCVWVNLAAFTYFLNQIPTSVQRKHCNFWSHSYKVWKFQWEILSPRVNK